METDPAATDEISLLDIAVVMADSWKLVLGSAILAGAMAFGIVTLLPARHQSEALVHLSSDEAALLQSPRVLDPAIRNTSLLSEFNNSVTEARRAVLHSMSTRQLGDSEIYKVTLSGSDPIATQNLLSNLLQQLIRETVPGGDQADLLKQELMVQQETLSTLKIALSRISGFLARAETSEMNKSSLLAGVGESIVALASATEAKQRDILNTTRALDGSVKDTDILLMPTLSDYPNKSSRLFIAAASAAIAGLCATIFAFMREGWRRGRRHPATSEKIERIKRSLHL